MHKVQVTPNYRLDHDKWEILPDSAPYDSFHSCASEKVGSYEPQRIEPSKQVSPRTDEKPLTIAALRQNQDLKGTKLPFLWKLHQMLEDVEKTGDDHIVSWLSHGRSFRVHKPKTFTAKIIPYYFRQTHYKSFQVSGASAADFNSPFS